MGGGVPPIPMDRTNPLSPVAFPSLHRLHMWGGELGLGAHPGEQGCSGAHPGEHGYPRIKATASTQRTVSMAYPLCSLYDEKIQPPAHWHRPRADERVMNFLGGAGSNSPRLHPFSRTFTQPAQDLRRNTSYNTDYCVPAALGPLRAASTPKLPPLEARYMPMGVDDWH